MHGIFQCASSSRHEEVLATCFSILAMGEVMLPHPVLDLPSSCRRCGILVDLEYGLHQQTALMKLTHSY